MVPCAPFNIGVFQALFPHFVLLTTYPSDTILRRKHVQVMEFTL